MKAVWHSTASARFAAQLGLLASEGLDVVSVAEADRDGFRREMRDAEVLLHILEPVTAAMIDGAPALRLIQKIGVGVNTIDLAAAQRRGIAVCNMPGSNTQAVAEMTLLLMLATLRRVVELDRLTRAGQGWSLPPDASDSFGELAGRSVGLIGFGAVGQRLAPMLRAIGARVMCTTRRPLAEAGVKAVPLAPLLARADIVSLHLPLTEETRGLIDAARLAAMKPGAILINTARGGLVDEPALVAALTQGRLRAAGLDVFAAEPVAPANPLLALPNVVVTPHLAWQTSETLDRSLAITAENCRRLAAGTALLHRIC